MHAPIGFPQWDNRGAETRRSPERGDIDSNAMNPICFLPLRRAWPLILSCPACETAVYSNLWTNRKPNGNRKDAWGGTTERRK
jgi:hypothetical protein